MEQKTLMAAEVNNQISDLYKGYINCIDLCNHLKNNLIDTGVRTKFSHTGFDYEDSIALFYYSDSSVLAITSSVIRVYKEVKK